MHTSIKNPYSGTSHIAAGTFLVLRKTLLKAGKLQNEYDKSYH